jgi:hypothetical protein
MSGTLPLFEDAAEGPDPAAAALPGRDERSGESPLKAARRLAREIRRLPDRSPAQIPIGLAICAHLQALLAESADPP